MRKHLSANYDTPYTHEHWLTRVRKSLLVTFIIVSLSLAAGVVGYHQLGALSWVDSLLEASMILGGMGSIAQMANDNVKVFASIYALYSGLALVSTTGLLLAPWLQRMLYQTHRQAHHDTLAARDAEAAGEKV